MIEILFFITCVTWGLLVIFAIHKTVENWIKNGRHH